MTSISLISSHPPYIFTFEFLSNALGSALDQLADFSGFLHTHALAFSAAETEPLNKYRLMPGFELGSPTLSWALVCPFAHGAHGWDSIRYCFDRFARA